MSLKSDPIYKFDILIYNYCKKHIRFHIFSSHPDGAILLERLQTTTSHEIYTKENKTRNILCLQSPIAKNVIIETHSNGFMRCNVVTKYPIHILCTNIRNEYLTYKIINQLNGVERQSIMFEFDTKHNLISI